MLLNRPGGLPDNQLALRFFLLCGPLNPTTNDFIDIVGGSAFGGRAACNCANTGPSVVGASLKISGTFEVDIASAPNICGNLAKW